MMEFLPPEIQAYCTDHSKPDSSDLQELIRYTYQHTEHPRMVSGSEVGNILQFIARMLNAGKILEIGTFTGYSALKMAAAVTEQGEIHTLEMDQQHAQIAQTFFQRSDDGDKITLHRGPALETLDQLGDIIFDMAFIDADKENYLNYYQRCMSLIRVGGVIVLDNMLWSGTVLEPEEPDAIALREAGDYIQNDDRVHNFLVPVRDGLMICHRLR